LKHLPQSSAGDSLLMVAELAGVVAIGYVPIVGCAISAQQHSIQF